MKVCLINPAGRVNNGAQPISLAILAAYLRKFGHDAIIVDMAAGDNAKVKVEGYKPDLIGITGTTPVIKSAYIIADYFRHRGYRVVLGGAHATALPEEAIRHADAVVVGEGEKMLIKVLENGLNGILKGEPIMDLDEIPMPAYDLMHMEFYLNTDRMDKFLVYSENERVGNILTSRGCSNNCTFCHNSAREIKYRANSARRVVDEIKYLMENYNINAIFFIEDNFFMNKKRVKEICKLLMDECIYIPFGANARVNNVDADILAVAKKAGCRQVTFGWESGSQRILDSYNKKTTVKQNVDSIRLCNEAGILPNGTLMIGAIGENMGDIELTHRFLLENDIRGGAAVCITSPFPATELWNYCVSHGLLNPNTIDYDSFDFSKIPVNLFDGISDAEAFEILRKLRTITGLQRQAGQARYLMEKITL